MQAPANSFDRISPTALMVAYARQFTDIPYSQELSQLADAQAVVEQLPEYQSRFVGGAVLFEGRYKAINQVMAQFKTTQIIELASGLLPRGMVVSQDPCMTFVESDLPAMISRKQQLVKQLIGERSNLHFVAIDATSQPNQFPLHTDYLNSQEPITILCEGLLMFLTFTQKQQVFANVREQLQISGGAWITSDLVTKQGLGRRLQADSGVQRLAQTVNQMTGTSWMDNSFDSFDQVKQFAGEQGFAVEEYSMLNVLHQLTCLRPLGIEPGVAESLLADSSVYALTLNCV